MSDISLKKRMQKHFRKRFRDHYGVFLRPSDITNIKTIIKQGEVRLLRHQRNLRSVYKLRYLGCEIVVVYESHTDTLVTALPNYSEKAKKLTWKDLKNGTQR